MEILTDIKLRAHWFKRHEAVYYVAKGTMLTPAAKDFVKEHGIRLIYEDETDAHAAGEASEPVLKKSVIQEPQAAAAHARKDRQHYQAMPMAPVPAGKDGKPSYVDGATGDILDEKPENMTHLHGNVLVPKTHPRIAFRGMLDSLEAKILSVQVMAGEDGLHRLTDALDEVLVYVRHILSAEVLNTPLEEMHLLGLGSEGLRYESHHIQKIYGIPHPMPEYRMGRICVALNELRTLVREAELAAAKAFTEKDVCTRPDIIEAMNRLSSVIYILFCRQLTGKWPGMADTQESPGFLVEASGRHVHLTKEAIEVLFGEPLHEKSPLSQPGQYAAKERVRLVTAKGELERVVVLGPPRDAVQVEMSLTDARILGIDIPVNLSGDLKGAGDVIIVGPKGILNAPGSVIASKAHIHMAPEDAKRYGVEDGDSVSVRLDTKRPVTIDDVIIRVSEKFSLAMHMDYDEANACLLQKGDLGYIIKKGM
jgi:propanediol utilization protein/ethanolamine utilization cobalamin adenosyltransferase